LKGAAPPGPPGRILVFARRQPLGYLARSPEGHACSDHAVTLTDELQAIAQEIVWGGNTGRVRIGLDYFYASINRVAAGVIGACNMEKALLLALVEDAKVPLAGAIWDYYCLRQGVPVGDAWFAEVKHYEADVLSQRK
jgi:L-rhamnose isomerase